MTYEQKRLTYICVDNPIKRTNPIGTSLFHESFLVAFNLGLVEIDGIAVKILTDLLHIDQWNGRTARILSQNTFLNGYRYAEQGESGLDGFFKKMLNSPISVIGDPKYKHVKNRFDQFLHEPSFALDIFNLGVKLYEEH